MHNNLNKVLLPLKTLWQRLCHKSHKPKCECNKLDFPDFNLKEIESGLDKIGNDRLQLLQRYLRYYKYVLVEGSVSNVVDVKDIYFRNGGLTVLNNLIKIFERSKKSDSFRNLITGNVEQVNKDKESSTSSGNHKT